MSPSSLQSGWRRSPSAGRGTSAKVISMRAMVVSMSARPERTQVHHRVTGLPPAEKTLDRRMERDPVEVVEDEKAVTTHRSVDRGDRLERAVAEIAGEDDVHDVLGARILDGRD